jgi:hypothetical protein
MNLGTFIIRRMWVVYALLGTTPPGMDRVQIADNIGRSRHRRNNAFQYFHSKRLLLV